MSCFYLPKKLKQLPSSSKKAWRSFTSSLSPKLRHLHNHSLGLARTTTRLLLERGSNKGHRRPPPRSRGAHGGAYYYYYKQYYNMKNNYQHFKPSPSVSNSPATVYIDRLFGESPSTTKEAKTTGVTMETASTGGGSDGTSRNMGGGEKRKVRKRKSNNNNSKIINDDNNKNWKEYVSSMPTIKGVDERAEEFISNFRQQMEIQREQSLIDFQEMLARSA